MSAVTHLAFLPLHKKPPKKHWNCAHSICYGDCAMRLKEYRLCLKLWTGTHDTSQACSCYNQSGYVISRVHPLEQATTFLILIAKWELLRALTPSLSVFSLRSLV